MQGVSSICDIYMYMSHISHLPCVEVEHVEVEHVCRHAGCDMQVCTVWYVLHHMCRPTQWDVEADTRQVYCTRLRWGYVGCRVWECYVIVMVCRMWEVWEEKWVVGYYRPAKTPWEWAAAGLLAGMAIGSWSAMYICIVQTHLLCNVHRYCIYYVLTFHLQSTHGLYTLVCILVYCTHVL